MEEIITARGRGKSGSWIQLDTPCKNIRIVRETTQNSFPQIHMLEIDEGRVIERNHSVNHNPTAGGSCYYKVSTITIAYHKKHPYHLPLTPLSCTYPHRLPL
jgi:hypothetical protein